MGDWVARLQIGVLVPQVVGGHAMAFVRPNPPTTSCHTPNVIYMEMPEVQSTAPMVPGYRP